MADETAAAEAETPEVSPETNGARRAKLLRILAIVVVTIAILWGLWYFLTQAGRVHTDNAYVGADSAQVTALIAGPVKEVRVSGTQAVKKGDILVVLDDADQRIAVADAEAALRLARQRYGQADAMATLMRRTLVRTWAPILRSLSRMAPQVATASWVWRKPMRRSASSST